MKLPSTIKVGGLTDKRTTTKIVQNNMYEIYSSFCNGCRQAVCVMYLDLMLYRDEEVSLQLRHVLDLSQTLYVIRSKVRGRLI